MGLYADTLFVSALLLFLVQPMVGKLILPRLGGTPAVWNTCMVFFQAMLLVGYAYAHATGAWLSTRRQVLVHLLLMLVPLAVLPIAVASNVAPPATDLPVGWLLWQLFLGVGLPFFVVSSSAPLLQKWFAQSGHVRSADPYFLYAASNVGSLLALLSYPLIVEPAWPLEPQTTAWTWGYSALFVMVALCGGIVWRGRAVQDVSASLAGVPREETFDEVAARPAWRQRLHWILLSAIPSSLMLGVTTYMTTDLAAVPLMWVVPLAIYLLTFVFVFARRPPIAHGLVAKLLPFLVLPMGVLLFFRPAQMEWLTIPAHLLTFFVVTMLCHGELVQRRPKVRYLTEFYLLMSLGGVLGGLFNAIVAPQVFTSIAEYPLVIALACFMLPRAAHAGDERAERRRDLLIPLAMAAGVGCAVAALCMTAAGRTTWALPLFFVIGLLI